MIAKKVVLKFPKRLVDQPVTHTLVKQNNLEFNILKASITPHEEGLLVMELKGNNNDFDKGMQYLMRIGVLIQPLSQDIVRNESLCTHCGACVVICPVDALVADPATREVQFYSETCIACELCVLACPMHAMEVHY